MANTTQKFIEIKSGEDDERKNAWFSHCQAPGIPYITITTRTKFADVLWDYISYPSHHDRLFNTEETTIKNTAQQIYKIHQNKNSNLHANSVQISITGVLLENARRVASDIFDLINQLASEG